METPKVPETKVVYYPEEEDTGYLIRVPAKPDEIVLGDVRTALGAAVRQNSKFFFKSSDPELGVVKEEIKDDNTRLPLFKGSVICYLVSADGSNHSDTTSQCTDNNATLTPGGVQRTQGIGDSRPPSFHAHGEHPDQSTCTSETESTISGLPKFPRHGSKLDRRLYRGVYDDRRLRRGLAGGARRVPRPDGSAMTSDLDTTSFFESEDDRASRVSSSTDFTSVSRMYARQRRKRRMKRNVMSRASSITSITDSSMSLNIINVMLNMDTVSFLGISIVGQTNHGGDFGIYVGSVMNGGAVALDGRIEAGDLILEVNDVRFENMSNDAAVQVLREAVRKPGPIKLVVAKAWDASPKGYFTVPREEPVRPIDPGAWVAHTNAMRGDMVPPPPGELPARPPSVSTLTSNSGSLPSSVPESDRYWHEEVKLDLSQHDVGTVVRAMARPDSGLDVKDRTWLKINIPHAFIGSDVVDWLQSHVEGFADRRAAKKYAARMLSEGYIRHTVNKSTFSEQCYYIFADLSHDLASLRLNQEQQGTPFLMHGGSSDSDTLPPLPPPTATHAPTPTAWAMGAPPALTPTPTNTFHPDDPLATPLAPLSTVRGPSMVGSLGSLQPRHQVAPPGSYLLPPTAAPSMSEVTRSSEMNSTSGGSAASGSGSDRNNMRGFSRLAGGSFGAGSVAGGPSAPEHMAAPRGSVSVAGVPSAPGPPLPTSMADDLGASRQSFKMAMGNPCVEHFIDVM